MASYTFGINSAPLTGSRVFNGSDADAQTLLDWASVAYAARVLEQSAAATFMGTINGTALSIVQLTGGTAIVGHYVYGPGVSGASRIVSGNGTSWILAYPSSVATAVEMTSHGPGQVGTQLGIGTMNSWMAAAQKLEFDANRAQVPSPPQMGWT